MEMEEDDPYASILQVCTNPTLSHAEPPLRLTHNHNNNYNTSLVLLPQTQTRYCRFIDHFPESYGAIIPPESIGEYLCPSPDTSPPHHHHHHPPNNINDYDDNIIINDDHNNINDDDHIIINDDDHNTNNDDHDFIVEEANHPTQIHTPPCVVSYQILSPPPLDSPFQTLEDDNVFEDDTMADIGLWLSQLKSMARQEEGFFDDVVSLVTAFRASQYSFSSRSRRKVQSSSLTSVSGVLSRKRPKLKLVDCIEDVRPKSSSKKRDLDLGSSSKSKGKNVSANNLGLEPSNSSTFNELGGTEGTTVIVLSDSQEEHERERGGSGGTTRASGLGNDSTMKRVLLKESQLGISKADGSHSNVASTSLGTKNAGAFNKPICSRGTNGSGEGFHEAESSVAISGGKGCGSSSFQGDFLTMVSCALKLTANRQASGNGGNAKKEPKAMIVPVSTSIKHLGFSPCLQRIKHSSLID